VAAAAGKGAAPRPAPAAPAPAAPAAKSEPVARPAPAPAATTAAPAPAPSDGANRIFASPLARRLAKTAGIELNRIRGSGPHGRIIARDIETARSSPGVSGGAPLAVQAPSDDKIRALFEPGSYDVIPHDNIRKVIARRLVEAKLTIPHFYLTLDSNIAKLLAAREEINAAAPKDKDGKPAYKLSVNDFVIKALALAMQRIPDANVTWTEGGMLKHHHSDIGVAVAIPGGLITPV